DTIEMFEAEGVATKIEPTGKVFPVSNKASDVLNALLARLQRSGATLALEEPVTELMPSDFGFRVATSLRQLSARAVILTTGGSSYPGSGTTGDGYRLAAALGHMIIPPRPALTPITSRCDWVAALRGLTLPDVSLTLLEADKKLASCRGSLLFAHFGL